MGLDMWLNKKTYVRNWSFMKDNERHEVTVKKGGVVYTAIKPDRISYIIEEVATWRKANQIHKWFVDNVQGGEDECKPHMVEFEHLKTLLRVVRKVKRDHALASKLLPVQPGFFFGSQEYDSSYFEDLDYTEKTLKALLAEPGAETAEYEYDSSW